ncbi:MAG TPA: DMT family transporter [Ktedonobacteraceae bacterium]|nr:DMT family transporter [Ktedonobacteraceae bacterium]
MRIKIIAGLAFFLNVILFATYYSVAREALGRFDPIIFSYFEMMALVPAAICIILLSWREISRAVVNRGFILGSCLCLSLFTIGIALKYTTATSTAFFPSLNGFFAALIAWLFFRQPISRLTWFAGILSIAGALLLITNTPMGDVRGSLIAFLGGLFFTCYVFLGDHQHKDTAAHWPLFGIELLTMAVWANLIVLLFGNWQAVHPQLPKDIWVVLYIAGACTFLPVLITVLMQKHISAVTISFIYILEPILGAVIANIYLHETLPLPGYAGGALVVVGAVIHTWGSIIRPANEPSAQKLLVQALSPLPLPEPVIWEIRSHRQVGTIPYGLARKGEKILVRRRRRQRLQRLGQLESLPAVGVYHVPDTSVLYNGRPLMNFDDQLGEWEQARRHSSWSLSAVSTAREKWEHHET